MRIAINHLTRMYNGRICVAGLNLEDEQHVRPILQPGYHFSSKHLVRFGGPLALGSIVDLGPVIDRGQPPEMEDRQFQIGNARVLSIMGPNDFWTLLQRVSDLSLRGIFGDVLTRQGSGSYGVDPGHGRVSLGVFAPTGRPRLEIRTFNERPRVRLHVADADGGVWLPATDVRLFADDMITPSSEAITYVASRLNRGARTLLSVGLARPWAPPGDMPRHWLQVNNVHLADDPLWDGTLPGQTRHS